MGFELVDNGGENGIREAVKGSPLGVSERSLHGPDVLGGERPESSDRVIRGGRGSSRVGGGSGGGGGGGRGGGRRTRGGNIGKNRGDGEEQERGGGGGG